jgi:hypothetical protein
MPILPNISKVEGAQHKALNWNARKAGYILCILFIIVSLSSDRLLIEMDDWEDYVWDIYTTPYDASFAYVERVGCRAHTEDRS